MKTFLLDLDGTMYRGTQLIETAKIFLETLQEKNIPYIFLTNNAMRTREENVIHMEKMGYANIQPESFFNSAMAAAKYAKKNYEGNRAYYIGGQGMYQALEEEGFEITEENPQFVFVGLDKTKTYSDYSHALTFLLQGAKLIGTNDDRLLAKPTGFEIGNGSIVAMYEYATGQKSPKIGKPSAPILDLCLEQFHLKKEDVVLIGDNLETDIALGCQNGVETIFVETGVHKREDIQNFTVQPDHIVGNMTEIDLSQFGW